MAADKNGIFEVVLDTCAQSLVSPADEAAGFGIRHGSSGYQPGKGARSRMSALLPRSVFHRVKIGAHPGERCAG